MQLELSPLIETLDIKVGDRIVPLKIDITADARKRFGATFITVAQKLQAQEVLFDKAVANGNEAEMDRCRQKTADLFEEAFVSCIGKDSYNALIDVATGGNPSLRVDCSGFLTNVMHGISEVIKLANKRDEDARKLGSAPDQDMTAMRDLKGEEVAQPVPDQVVA